jgi:hypothetical protein
VVLQVFQVWIKSEIVGFFIRSLDMEWPIFFCTTPCYPCYIILEQAAENFERTAAKRIMKKKKKKKKKTQFSCSIRKGRNVVSLHPRVRRFSNLIRWNDVDTTCLYKIAKNVTVTRNNTESVAENRLCSKHWRSQGGGLGGSNPPEIPKFWKGWAKFPVLWNIHL